MLKYQYKATVCNVKKKSNTTTRWYVQKSILVQYLLLVITCSVHYLIWITDWLLRYTILTCGLGWVKFFATINYPPPPPQRALSGALSGLTTVWFCCRVWLFNQGSYFYRKEIIPHSAPGSTIVYSTLFYVWEVQISNLTGREQSKNLIQA